MRITMIAFQDGTGHGGGHITSSGWENGNGGYDMMTDNDAPLGEASALVEAIDQLFDTVDSKEVGSIIYPLIPLFESKPFQDQRFGVKVLDSTGLWHRHPFTPSGVGCPIGKEWDYDDEYGPYEEYNEKDRG